MELYHGNIVYSKNKNELVEYANAYIAVENGIIEGIYEQLPEKYKKLSCTDFGNDVIIPAFTDLHVHAPQYPQRSLAMDEVLVDWLDKYTFPLENKFKDIEFAKAVYDKFIDELIANGTMHAAVFGTIHNEATGYLIEQMEKKGLLAYVGKVNMDINSPDYLCEDTENSIKDTERFIDKYINNKYAKPIITPRFAPTCSDKLLKGLGEIGKKYNVGVQTHIEESIWESNEALNCHPNYSCDMEIYEKAGLLDNGPVIADHFIFPKEKDIEILNKYNGYAVQCPEATVNIIAGIMQTGNLLDREVKIGLGSDIAAGYGLSVYSQVAKAIQLSKIKSFYEQDNRKITFAEAFCMATKGGGSLFGKVGSFEKGYSFDALVISGVSDTFEDLTPIQKVERFCGSGETKNIKEKFIRGKKI